MAEKIEDSREEITLHLSPQALDLLWDLGVTGYYGGASLEDIAAEILMPALREQVNFLKALRGSPKVKGKKR